MYFVSLFAILLWPDCSLAFKCRLLVSGICSQVVGIVSLTSGIFWPGRGNAYDLGSLIQWLFSLLKRCAYVWLNMLRDASIRDILFERSFPAVRLVVLFIKFLYRAFVNETLFDIEFLHDMLIVLYARLCQMLLKSVKLLKKSEYSSSFNWSKISLFFWKWLISNGVDAILHLFQHYFL